MSDFTKGPWHDRIDDDGELYVEMGDGHYAYFGDVENTCGTCHANARLTAAAPSLYEALKDTLEALEELWFGHLPGAEPVDTEAAIDLGRAALRRARGDDE